MRTFEELLFNLANILFSYSLVQDREQLPCYVDFGHLNRSVFIQMSVEVVSLDRTGTCPCSFFNYSQIIRQKVGLTV